MIHYPAPFWKTGSGSFQRAGHWISPVGAGAIHWIEHDLDEPRDWPESYALILVVRYVNLPLVEKLAKRLAPGGFLLLEMHLDTNAEVAGPSNPAYRVRPGELEGVTDGLKIHHQEEAITRDRDGKTVALARVVAQRVA